MLFRMQVSRTLREAGKNAAAKGGIPTAAQKNSTLKDQLAPISRFWKGIRQAKSNDGGIIPSIRGPFTRLMRDSYIRYGDFVGEDARGNKYYINNEYPVGRNRYVVYAEKNFEQRYDFDASDIPAEWHRWLHYMTDDPPTPEGVPPTERKFITEHVRNITGTPAQYVPYTTTRKKVESWDPNE